MIVIGVAPGLKALTYAVLEFPRVPAPAIVLDKDVLLGPKLPGRDDEAGFLKGLVELTKKAYVHHLILEVVFERVLVPFGRAKKPWAALAIGPPCNPKEPPEHVRAVSVMVTHLARRFQIPTMPVTDHRMQQVLVPAHRESWLRVCDRFIAEPLDTEDKKSVLAVAIALTGGLVYRASGEAQ
jgi:hypothetical protein